MVEYCAKSRFSLLQKTFREAGFSGLLRPGFTKSHLTWARRLVMMKWT